MEVVERNISALAGLYARKKCCPVMGDISDAGLSAMVGKALKANATVHLTDGFLGNNTADTNLLPTHGLNGKLQELIKTYTAVMQVPQDYFTCSMFSVASTLIGNKVTVWNGTYPNNPNIWLILVGNSGIGKSAPIKMLMQPIADTQNDNYEQYKSEMREWRKCKDEDKPDKPHLKQFYVSDTTPEGLYKVLAENPNGLLLYRDEIKGFFDDMGRYNKSGEESNYLSIWDGTTVTINRKNDEPLYIKHPFLSMIGGTQPGLLKQMFSERLLQSGFLQRILFCYPEATFSHYSNKQLPQTCQVTWNDYCHKLMQIPQCTLTLDGGAAKLYETYYNELQDKMPSADEYVISMYNKLQISVLKWSVVAHFLGDDMDVAEVTENDMGYSVDCMEYFERNWMKVYDKLHQDKQKPTREQCIKYLGEYYGKALNQSKLAEALGVTQPRINQIINGK